jgi:LytR cell envelope-related transcriptional attenuator
VEHAVPFEPFRWRTAALVASGIAALELIGLIVVGTVALGHSVTSGGAAAAARPKPRPVAKPMRHTLLPRTKTRVVVLNGNGQAGAAGTEADAIRARGYKVSAVGNAPAPAQGPSLVMYRPGYSQEAHRLARDAGIGIVSALDGMTTSSLHRAQLVILLGSS